MSNRLNLVQTPSTGAQVASALGYAAGSALGSVTGTGNFAQAFKTVGTGTGNLGLDVENTTGFDNMKELLNLQMQVQQKIQQFTTLTNLAKTEHDGRMSAVRNMRS